MLLIDFSVQTGDFQVNQPLVFWGVFFQFPFFCGPPQKMRFLNETLSTAHTSHPIPPFRSKNFLSPHGYPRIHITRGESHHHFKPKNTCPTNMIN